MSWAAIRCVIHFVNSRSRRPGRRAAQSIMILDCRVLDETSWMFSLWALWVISKRSASFFIWMAYFTTVLNRSTVEAEMESLPKHNKPPHEMHHYAENGFFPVSYEHSGSIWFKLIMRAIHSEFFHRFLVYVQPTSVSLFLMMYVVQLR